MGGRLSGRPPFIPVIETRDRNSGLGEIPDYFWYVSNGGFGEGQASQPLVIDFDIPAEAVLFRPATYTGLPSNKVVYLEAFDSQGSSLGTIEHPGISAPFGLRTTSPLGISKIVFDYRDPYPESIESLVVDYLDGERAFTTYLAQIGSGRTSSASLEDVSLTTSFILSNPSDIQAQGLISFFDNDGQPLLLTLNGAAASTLGLSIDPFKSAKLEMDVSSSTVLTGYAVVRANVPLDSLAIFSVLGGSGEELSNADVDATKGFFSAVAPVQQFSGSQSESGLAIVNTGPDEAQIWIEGQGLETAFLTLSPGEHVAEFLSEMFPSLQGDAYDGSLHIVSNQPVAVVALRTRGGLPVSAVPVSSVQR